MESILLDVYQFLTEKHEPLHLDLESVNRKAEFFRKGNPECMSLELSILLSYLYTSPLQTPDQWEFAEAEHILKTATQEVKHYHEKIYKDEIVHAEIRNGYLLIIYNFLSSMSKHKVLQTDICEEYQRHYEKVRRACGDKSAASIRAFIAFALYIFGEKKWMERALHHINAALETQDLPQNCHWQYIKGLILERMLTPTLHMANTIQNSQDNFPGKLVILCDELEKNDQYHDWACLVKEKCLSSNEETSVQPALSNISVTTPTIVTNARMFIEQGEFDRAKELLEKLPDKSDEVLFLLGYISKELSNKPTETALKNTIPTEQARQCQHLEDALSLFQDAITSNKNNMDARMHKVITLALLGKEEESHKELRRLKFMLTKRNLPIDLLVFHAELLKLEKYLKLSNRQVQQCIRTIVENSLKHFAKTKEEKKRVQFSVNYINRTVDMILEKLSNLHEEDKEDKDIAKTYAWVLLNLQLFKEAKHIYKILYTKLQEVYDADVVLGLARAYCSLREFEKVKELAEILRKDEKMAHLADKITQDFGQLFHALPERAAFDSKDQINYKRRERSRSFSATTFPSITALGQRSVPGRRMSGDLSTFTMALVMQNEREEKLSEIARSSFLPVQNSSDDFKDQHRTSTCTTKDASAAVVSTRALSLVAEAIVSKRKEFAREYLNLEEPEIIDIENSHKDSTKEAAFQMLQKWKERSGLEATPNCLYEMIQSSKKFPEDVLGNIRGFLTTGDK